MSVTSKRSVNIEFGGDILYTQLFEAADNIDAPADFDRVDLLIGDNTVTPPVGATGCTILPPAGNAVVITLKGAIGEIGIILHNTDPTSIGLGSGNDFVLSTSAAVDRMRIVWT